VNKRFRIGKVWIPVVARGVEKKPHAMFLAAIPGFGFFVIGLVCLYHLLNAL
jgi:hypothetical protein